MELPEFQPQKGTYGLSWRPLWCRHVQYKSGHICNGWILKYTQDVYRQILAINPRYECPPSIPEREWKEIIDDAKENILSKSKEQITSTPR